MLILNPNRLRLNHPRLRLFGRGIRLRIGFLFVGDFFLGRRVGVFVFGALVDHVESEV